MAGLKQKYTVPKFWIMLEKEFKDDKDKLVSSVCKYDSANGALSYCGTICLQMNEEAILKPTTEFFNMILYNSDPNSKVTLVLLQQIKFLIDDPIGLIWLLKIV